MTETLFLIFKTRFARINHPFIVVDNQGMLRCQNDLGRFWRQFICILNSVHCLVKVLKKEK